MNAYPVTGNYSKYLSDGKEFFFAPSIAFSPRTKRILLLLAFSLILVMEGHAQNDSLDFYDATGIYVEGFGPSLFGLNANYYLGNRVSFNLGAGINLDLHLGANLYLINRARSNHSLYISGQVCMIRELTMPLYVNISSKKKQTGLFVPLGYEFVGNKGFSVQLECGPNFVNEDYGQTNTKPVVFLIRLGKTFGIR